MRKELDDNFRMEKTDWHNQNNNGFVFLVTMVGI